MIKGNVFRNPYCEPCAAQRILFGPGVKHIGTIKTNAAIRRSESIRIT
jgi:hypothetical protein